MYARASAALRQAKSIEDLDEINRSFDTQDWTSIVPGQEPRGWPELRKYGFANLFAPFESMELRTERVEITGETAILTGKLRVVSGGKASLVPLKETWRRTPFGWKRAVHEKLGPPVPDSTTSSR